MREAAFFNKVLQKVSQLQKECGNAFLELMVDTIILKDSEGREIRTLYGFEYNLARSRHWDKQQQNYIFYDGFTDRHLTKLYNDIIKTIPEPASIHFVIDGMNDLDEAIHGNIDLEFNNIHE